MISGIILDKNVFYLSEEKKNRDFIIKELTSTWYHVSFHIINPKNRTLESE